MPSIPPALQFMFVGGDTPWAPLPDPGATPNVPAVAGTIEVGPSGRTINANEVVLVDAWAMFLNSYYTDFTNHGTLWNQTVTTSPSIFGATYWNIIKNFGKMVSLNGEQLSNPGAYGIADFSTGIFENYGDVFVVSRFGHAIGVSALSDGIVGESGTPFQFGSELSKTPYLNAGNIYVWSGDVVGHSANGFDLAYGGHVVNTGLIDVSGASRARGIFSHYRGFALENSGVIEVESQGNVAPSYGVWVNEISAYSDAFIINSGSITADIAIYVFNDLTNRTLDPPPPFYISPFTLKNSGVINGAIILEGTPDHITNTGVINGPVTLGDQSDSFDGGVGQLTGILLSGDGNDTVLSGVLADTVHGDFGDDYIDGGKGNDKLYGEDGADTLIGGAGADILEGGHGYDTTSYVTSGAGVFVRLGTNQGLSGHAQGDSFNEIENIFGSAFRDILIGDVTDNVLFGGAGADDLWGLQGNDTIAGEFGADLVTGAAGDDAIFGGADNDTLSGGTGADTLNGGGGVDLATYFGAPNGIFVRLDTGVGSAGQATGDVLKSIENIRGTNQRDIIIGDGAANMLVGEDGSDDMYGGSNNDDLQGGTGDDNLFGQTGNDTLSGGPGDDIMTGGSGDDVFTFKIGDNADLIIDLTAGAATDDIVKLLGFGAAFDTFAEVLSAASQSGADVVISFGGGDTLTLQNVTVGNLNQDDFVFG